MEVLTQWLGEHLNIIGSFQIVLDLVILLILFCTFFYAKRPKAAPGAEGLIQSLERVIEETKTIGSEFERNLQERQDVIQQLLSKLDHRLREARELCTRLEGLQEERLTDPYSQKGASIHSGYRKVLLLAQKGLDAEAIAKRLQKPLGEVELILNLERMSSAK